jgi:hypothetical protein
MFRRRILQSSGILLLLFLMEWWIIYLSPFNIPEYIPNTPIKIDGLLLSSTIIILLLWQFKNLLLVLPTLSIWKLTMIGTLTVFIAEVLFQSLRQFHMNADTLRDHIYYFILGTMGVSLFSTVIAFLIAFQLKTKRTNTLLLLIFLILGGVYIVKTYLFTG